MAGGQLSLAHMSIGVNKKLSCRKETVRLLLESVLAKI